MAYKLVEIRCYSCGCKLLEAGEGAIVRIKCRKSSCGCMIYGRVTTGGVDIFEEDETRVRYERPAIVTISGPTLIGYKV